MLAKFGDEPGKCTGEGRGQGARRDEQASSKRQFVPSEEEREIERDSGSKGGLTDSKKTRKPKEFVTACREAMMPHEKIQIEM
jgi:hypothetical protein